MGFRQCIIMNGLFVIITLKILNKDKLKFIKDKYFFKTQNLTSVKPHRLKRDCKRIIACDPPCKD